MNGLTPGTRSGRLVAREDPPPGVLMTAVRSAAALDQTAPVPSMYTMSGRVMSTGTGKPLRALPMPPTDQPPFHAP